MDVHTTPRKLYADQMVPCPLPFCATRDDSAPIFSAEVYVNGEIQTINIDDFHGKWRILFFYASDFTFV